MDRNNNTNKKVYAVRALLIMLFVLALILCSCSRGSGAGSKKAPENTSDVQNQLEDICDYLESVHEGTYRAGESSSDWTVIIYSQAGRDFDFDGYLKDMEQYVTEKYSTDEKLDGYKATEWAHVCLAIKACGGDPQSFGKDKKGKPINLVADGTYDWSQTDDLADQGSNALIYALITLDDGGYEVPEGSKYTREKILSELIQYQDEDGAFALGKGEKGSTDITAMAIQALAPYYDKDVKALECVDRGLAYLSNEQQESGLYLSGEGYSSETISQVIMALCALGRNPLEDKQFTKGYNTLIDGLMQFKMDDGSFSHDIPDDPSQTGDNLMSSQQAGQAFCAMLKVEKGEE